jgi:hypothetical protein
MKSAIRIRNFLALVTASLLVPGCADSTPDVSAESDLSSEMREDVIIAKCREDGKYRWRGTRVVDLTVETTSSGVKTISMRVSYPAYRTLQKNTGMADTERLVPPGGHVELKDVAVARSYSHPDSRYRYFFELVDGAEVSDFDGDATFRKFPVTRIVLDTYKGQLSLWGTSEGGAPLVNVNFQDCRFQNDVRLRNAVPYSSP